MYAVVRRYTAANDLTNLIAEKRSSLEQAMKGLPGFVAYYLVHEGDALATITICQDRAGAEESIQRAADWVKQNLPADSGLSAPEITQGNVLVSAGT
jgi:hypothetical protein